MKRSEEITKDYETIPVNSKTMTAEIDVRDDKKVYFIDDGEVKAIPLPPFGALEIPCQNFKIGNPRYIQSLRVR